MSPCSGSAALTFVSFLFLFTVDISETFAEMSLILKRIGTSNAFDLNYHIYSHIYLRLVPAGLKYMWITWPESLISTGVVFGAVFAQIIVTLRTPEGGYIIRYKERYMSNETAIMIE